MYNETRDCKDERGFAFPDVEMGQNYTYNVSITNIVGPSSKEGVVGMYLLIWLIIIQCKLYHYVTVKIV